jgi:hypothetical protein
MNSYYKNGTFHGIVPDFIEKDDPIKNLLVQLHERYVIGRSSVIEESHYDDFVKSMRTIQGNCLFDFLKSWIPTRNAGTNGSILKFLLALRGYEENSIKYPTLNEVLEMSIFNDYASKLKKN